MTILNFLHVIVTRFGARMQEEEANTDARTFVFDQLSAFGWLLLSKYVFNIQYDISVCITGLHAQVKIYKVHRTTLLVQTRDRRFCLLFS